MIDIGTGPPVVLIPGIQGRWEWMRPAVDQMSSRTRVISFSLAGEPGSDRALDDESGFDAYIAQVDAVIDRAGLASATICGVSFGGLIALHYAAARPERVRALVLVSTPGPAWNLPPQTRRYMRHPRLMFPLFCVGAYRRMSRELAGTFPIRRQRIGAAVRYGRLVLGAPGSPSRMSRRASQAFESPLTQDCARIAQPTLVVTGEPDLDGVVPVATSLEYARLIKGAQVATLAGTGHLGVVTRPERFAELITGFALAHAERRSADRVVTSARGVSA
ncbi:MAG TPA: alpha/beta hydrolase [Vicinamibacterales bacterium]